MKRKSTYTRLWFLATMLLLLALGSRAQDKRSLSLSDAITMGIQNSKQLKLSKTKIDAALASFKTASNAQLPNVSASGSYLRLNQPNIDMQVKLGDDNGGNTSKESPKVSQVAFAMATVEVPIFNGFIIQSHKASARYLAEAARLDADKDREAVIENIVNAYSNLYKAEQAVYLVQENLRQQQQRVADFSNLEKNGLLARNDLLKAQLQQSNIEVSLTEAQSNLKVALISMNLLLGLPENTQLALDTTAFNQPLPQDARAAADWEQVALQHRKDAAALQAREKAAAAGIRAAKGEYYPSLAFTGGYVAANIPHVLTVTNAVNAGIGLKYSPSSLWKTGSKVAEAKAQLQEVKVNEEMLADNIHLSVNKAFEEYVLNQKKIEMYQKAIEQADENYRITKNKQVNNLATTTDLLDADVAALQAKLNHAFAKADAVVSYTKLLETAGVLNEQAAAGPGQIISIQ